MNDERLPEWLMPYNDNYTGPFWSDGKWQTSTSRGKSRPKSKLDVRSMRHDADYATCLGYDCLEAADYRYLYNTRHMSFVPRNIGRMPYYGNFLSHRYNYYFSKPYVGKEAGEMTSLLTPWFYPEAFKKKVSSQDARPASKSSPEMQVTRSDVYDPFGRQTPEAPKNNTTLAGPGGQLVYNPSGDVQSPELFYGTCDIGNDSYATYKRLNAIRPLGRRRRRKNSVYVM